MNLRILHTDSMNIDFAKLIKLLDDANSDFKMPVNGVNFFTKSKINIENEK